MFGVAIAKLNKKSLVYKLTVENVQNCAAIASSVISKIQDSGAVKRVISGKTECSVFSRKCFSSVDAVVCYTAVFRVVTQRSSPLTAAENRTTFFSRD